MTHRLRKHPARPDGRFLPDPPLHAGAHARIVVDGDGVEVVVPRGFALRQVEPFVEEKRPWIERTLRRMRESEAELPPVRLDDGGEVPYLGERLALRLSPAPEPASGLVSGVSR